jgi:riboflavin kinase/FMN adenylyltransferase
VVAIGNFDGVHRGHQALLASIADDARRRGLAPAVLTFWPHPRVALGQPVPPVLTTLDRKLELIRAVDPAITIHVTTFDAAFAAQSPEQFATTVLREDLGAKVVVVGLNFRFGARRAGGFDDLARLGAALDFETRSHDMVGDERGAWSSSRVRYAVARGDLAEVQRMLARPHMLSGVVVHGDHRGRTLGFPTCNLAEVEEAMPPFGVYAVLVDRVRDDGAVEALARGVANIGVRPTIEGAAPAHRVEVHLLRDDATPIPSARGAFGGEPWATHGDLYSARLRVHLVARLRGEERFPDLAALKAQIARDADGARALLATLARAPFGAPVGAGRG